MTDDIAAARTAIAKLGFFASADPARIQIRRLGGLTNLVFRVDYDGAAYCMRLPGKGTEEYIDRKIEAHAAKAAAMAKVSPELLWFSDDGAMITRYLDGTRTMTPTLFKSTAGAPLRAGKVFKQLHTSGQTFNFRFELFKMIDEYLKVLSTKEVEFPEGYHDVLKEAETVRAALNARPVPLAPCHCDPLCENFLDTGERMWLVDWEYSGMNDPMWDLGDLSVEAGFDVVQEEEMLLGYFGAEPSKTERGRMVIYKAMCDLLWTLWGLIQHANKNPVDDFWAYSVNRFERCKKLMGGAGFQAHVAAVKAR
ncbi:MAG: choline/ethanolamine kinase family protein [Hyphomicrobiaceae bacterium]